MIKITLASISPVCTDVTCHIMIDVAELQRTWPAQRKRLNGRKWDAATVLYRLLFFLRGKWKLIDLSITNKQKTKKQKRLSKTSCSMSYTGLHLPSIFMISAVATSLPLRGAQAWICKIFLIIHIHNVIITQYIMSGTFTLKGSARFGRHAPALRC